MNFKLLKTQNKEINVFTNDLDTNEMIIYFHGLDGTPNFSKPLFKAFDNMLIVAPEQRGHSGSKEKSSRMIYKHLNDYLEVINHYKKEGKKIYIVAESMGSSYSMLLAYKYENLVEAIFCWSIPNKLVNVMEAPKGLQTKIQFMTFLSFLTNVKFTWIATVNYEAFSSSALLHRVARLADKSKKRDVRETLATWAANKRAWKYINRKDPLTKVFYFNGTDDIVSDLNKVRKAFRKRDSSKIELTLIQGGKHILMYEPQFEEIVSKIRKEMIVHNSKKED